MKIAMIRQGSQLTPIYKRDRENFAKLREGEQYVFDVRRERNLYHHRKFFAILQTVVSNSEKWSGVEELLVALKIKLGYVNVIQGFDGEQVVQAGSLKFDAADQDLFEKFYAAALPVLAREIGVTVQELEENSTEAM